jgi:hypothetical protein
MNTDDEEVNPRGARGVRASSRFRFVAHHRRDEALLMCCQQSPWPALQETNP